MTKKSPSKPRTPYQEWEHQVMQVKDFLERLSTAGCYQGGEWEIKMFNHYLSRLDYLAEHKPPPDSDQ